MKINHLTLFLFIILSFVFASCSDNVVADFSYSPKMPKRGEPVVFTNLSTGDEKWTVESWTWNFGDGSVSLQENPSHVYRNAGKYTVTLTVDSSKNFVKTMDIMVYDSIPTIIKDVDSVKYYQDLTFSVLSYNPNYADVSYEWTFSENAVSDKLVDGKSSESELTVFFNKKNIQEIVSLHIVIEGEIDEIVKDTFYVQDVKVKSLLLTQKANKILRQRIFNKGFEAATTTNIESGKHPFNMVAKSNMLYIFDAGSDVDFNANWAADASGDGNIRSVNLQNNETVELAHNRGTSSHFGFYNGCVDKNYIYWTDYSDFLYRSAIDSPIGAFAWKNSSDEQTKVPYYLVKSDRLGYFGKGMEQNQYNGGIAYFDQVYLWAKGGTGRGIHRFLATDILTENASAAIPAPSIGAILTDFAIRAFKIDELNQKIYFSVTAPANKVGLWVSNIDGSAAKQIDNAPMDDPSLFITGIAIDNESNKVYWAYRSPETSNMPAPTGTWADYYIANPTHRTGIKQATLATLYKSAGAVEYFALDIVAYGIALDNVKK